MQNYMKKIVTISLALMLTVMSVIGNGVVSITAQETLMKNETSTRIDESFWRHFVSGATNDNGASPALLKSDVPGVDSIVDGSIEMTIKPNSTKTDTRFGIYLKYKDANNFVFVGIDNSSNWFYEYKVGGVGSWKANLGDAAPQQGQEAKISVKYSGKNLNITINGKPTNSGNPFEIEALETLKNEPLRIKAGTFSGNKTDIFFKDVVIKSNDTVLAKDGTDLWSLVSSAKGEFYEHEYIEPEIHEVNVSGKVFDKDNNPLDKVSVKLDDFKTTTDANGSFTFADISTGKYNVIFSKAGYKAVVKEITVIDEDINLGNITLEGEEDINVVAPSEIESSKMKVGIDDKFPRVLVYEMKGENAGRKFYGQTEKLEVVKINGVEVKPEVAFTKTADSATYVMTLKDAAKDIDAVITAKLKVKDNILSFDITDIKDNKIVKTIEIPGHSLISVRNTQSNANFAGSNMSNNTHKNGDVFDSVSNLAVGTKGYMYAFVSSNSLSASLWSNSENNVTADWQRVTAVTKQYDTYKSVGLGSTAWTYQKSEAHRKQDKAEELPSMKVVVTGDENEDGVTDWQDGAIAYRQIMNNPQGYETVPNLVAMRIAMNFGSQAQNPFLVTLDNVKKVNLNTDGLGQMVLLKGYGSEGHDSGHLNYADIGSRIGGAEDMKTLLKKGKPFGAKFGVHVNASETYPESKYFDEARLRVDANGKFVYGWNWLDQGININADYDLRNGRADRFKDFYDELGGASNDLDFIYVDVWGNGQSGDNGTWASHQLAKEINQLGWRVAGEWGYAMENDSTFQHWATDLTYGGYALQGINSKIARFIRNHQKDSWVGDYVGYGGAANNPLLGGYDMKDFEGWQGRNDYNGYIKNLFDNNVSTKFVQHYKVTNWEDGTPVQMSDNDETYSWTPEMKITLQDDAKDHKLVIERKSNDVGSADYRMRTMMFDGKKIMDGETYLIPWFWDENGADLSVADQKLYHWNQKGGTTTWDVPAGWSGSVEYYELGELGKTNKKTVNIVGGKVTLDAKASTPYVIHKTATPNKTMVWSDGMHVVDAGFNSGNLDAWTIKGQTSAASIVKSQASNDMLSIANNTSEVTLTQTLTDLTPGKQYAAYVGVDNRSDVKAYIEVKSKDGVETNYTERSIAKNYIKAYAHNTNNGTTGGSSYFQNMYVFFTAPSDGSDVTLTLKREAGTGTTYFDDIRVFENNAKNKVDADTFKQDFEDVPQGIYPFVVGAVEGVNDNRTHLSELNAPYTQRGWNDKKVDDVIDGNWSLKTNGLVVRNSLVYQTIPQNFRFEPGVTYNISFEYEAGSNDTYAFMSGNGEYKSGLKYTGLEETISNGGARKFTARVTGSEDGQTWIGIYSTNVLADDEGAEKGDANFRGYKDIMLDNLVIEKSDAQKADLEKLVDENKGHFEANYSSDTWETFDKAMKKANEVLDNLKATQQECDAAKTALETAVANLKVIGGTLRGTAKDTSGNVLANVAIEVDMNGKKVEVKTAKNGTYVLPGILFGTWELKADSPYFKTNKQSITTSKTILEVEANIVMEAAQTSASGKITAVGKPIEGANIEISVGTKKYQTQSDAQGNYVFEDIETGQYTMLVTSPGYDVSSSELAAIKYNKVVKNVMLEPESGVDYENDFEDGRVTWDNLAGNTSSTTITAVNGQNVVKFPGGHANVYDTEAPKFKNGIVEMDLTPVKDSARLGVLLRAKDMNNRVYVGTLENSSTWFVEYWNPQGNAWSGGYAGPTLKGNEATNVKVEIIESTVKLWVNGEFVLEKTMDGMQLDSGAIGLNTRNVNEVAIDNVKVTSYDAPEGDVQVVAGHVSNYGDPVHKAKVELAGKTKAAPKTIQTDALGNYKFKNIPFGEYTVKATVDGEGTISKDITVKQVDGYIVVEEIRFNDTTPPVIDKDSLQAAIDEALTKVESDYTAASWKVFAKALADAQTILADVNATQEQVTLVETRLTTAQANLLEPTKETLEKLITVAKSLVKKDYTSASWKALQEKLSLALDVFANASATEAEIETAITELQKAIAGLVKAPVVTAPSEKTDGTTVLSANSTKTGDTTDKTLYFAMGGFMLGIMSLVVYKKRKRIE